MPGTPEQSPDPLRPPELVGGDAHRVGDLEDVEGTPTEELHRVHVEPGSRRPHLLGDGREGLDHPGLVVRRHDRHDGRSCRRRALSRQGGERLGDGGGVDGPRLPHREPAHRGAPCFELPGHRDDGGVLEGAGHQRGGGVQGQVVRLRPAGGEHQIPGMEREQGREDLSSALELVAGGAPRSVHARGVGPGPHGGALHGRHHRGVGRRGRVPIQIDPRALRHGPRPSDQATRESGARSARTR